MIGGQWQFKGTAGCPLITLAVFSVLSVVNIILFFLREFRGFTYSEFWILAPEFRPYLSAFVV